MTGFDYPPSRTWTLSDALEDVTERLSEAEAEVADLEAEQDDDTQPPRALREARQQRQTLSNQQDALKWACREFGDDAEVTIEAFTTGTRDRVTDTLRRTAVGPIGNDKLQTWLVAGGVTEAPWLATDDDLAQQAAYVEALPPALTTWIDDQLDDLNDLSEGN
jgi:hypothetical protein